MVRLLETCFADSLKSPGVEPQAQQIIPSWGQSLIDDAALCDKLRAETAAVLHLNTI
jgi:malate dehydrogenase (quinone)